MSIFEIIVMRNSNKYFHLLFLDKIRQQTVYMKCPTFTLSTGTDSPGQTVDPDQRSKMQRLIIFIYLFIFVFIIYFILKFGKFGLVFGVNALHVDAVSVLLC